MNKSELLTSLISKDIFLPQYVQTDVYVYNDKQEKEFLNEYVVIQIKERCDKNIDADFDCKWFKNKILNKAVSQIKNTFDLYAENGVILSKSTGKTLDKNKQLIPKVDPMSRTLNKKCLNRYEKNISFRYGKYLKDIFMIKWYLNNSYCLTGKTAEKYLKVKLNNFKSLSTKIDNVLKECNEINVIEND